jgi:hypothetical protein
MGRLCVWASLGSERHDQYFSFQLLAGHQWLPLLFFFSLWFLHVCAGPIRV